MTKSGENPSIGILLCHELPSDYKVLAPIIEEVPEILGETNFAQNKEKE